MKKYENVSFRDVDLKDGFWLKRYLLNKNVSLESVKNRFEETARFDALRFNYLKNGRKPVSYTHLPRNTLCKAS